MSCPRRRQCGGGNSWSYSWSTCNGVTTYKTSGNVPAQYLQQNSQSTTTQKSSGQSESKLETKSDDKKDYYEYGLYLHNWYRKRHGSPKMVLDDRLNKAADAYAYKLACARTLYHSSGLDYNENLYMSFDTKASKKEHVRMACKMWYDENKLYNYSNPGFSMQTGHFTAMVFKSCRQLGIGCWGANGCYVVVGCYKPHANMQGQFRTNVLPWREVEDSEDEKEEADDKKEKTGGSKQEENKSAVKESNSEKADASAESSEESSEEDDSTIGWSKLVQLAKDSKQEENKSVAKESNSENGDASPEGASEGDDTACREAFEGKCDNDSTIGWSELAQLLNDNFKVDWGFEGFDKTICSLLISMMTLRQGESTRVGLEVFKKITDSVIGFLDAYAEFDKDKSGKLDPFELKLALQESGFDISFKTYQTLQKLFAEEESEEMNFRGFVLCFILLSKLQIVQEKRTSFEDFSLKDWMQKEIESASAD